MPLPLHTMCDDQCLMLSMFADMLTHLWTLEPILVDGDRHGFHNQQEGLVMSHDHAIGVEQVTC